MEQKLFYVFLVSRQAFDKNNLLEIMSEFHYMTLNWRIFVVGFLYASTMSHTPKISDSFNLFIRNHYCEIVLVEYVTGGREKGTTNGHYIHTKIYCRAHERFFKSSTRQFVRN